MLDGLHLAFARLRFNIRDCDATTYTHDNKVELDAG